MNIYGMAERANDLRALSSGKIVQRMIRRQVWRIGTNLIRAFLRRFGL